MAGKDLRRRSLATRRPRGASASRRHAPRDGPRTAAQDGRAGAQRHPARVLARAKAVRLARVNDAKEQTASSRASE